MTDSICELGINLASLKLIVSTISAVWLTQIKYLLSTEDATSYLPIFIVINETASWLGVLHLRTGAARINTLLKRIYICEMIFHSHFCENNYSIYFQFQKLLDKKFFAIMTFLSFPQSCTQKQFANLFCIDILYNIMHEDNDSFAVEKDYCVNTHQAEMRRYAG